MAQEAELLYKTVQWDESLLQSAGKKPAGMLFNIKCSEDDAVRQLHLPHCETEDALLVEGLLSVVHITDHGMSILEPLEITDTHVAVKVPHLSAFGLVWDIVKRVLNISLPLNGQVLLFLRPPDRRHQVLYVFLLQDNIPVHEVAAEQGDAEYIRTSSGCRLSINQRYSVRCEHEDCTIQPDDEQFIPMFGPNFHPTFEVFLRTNAEEVTLMVHDQDGKDVWRRIVYLNAVERVPAEDRDSAEERLLSVRTKFVSRVSESTLNQLLDELLQHGVITDNELQTISSIIVTTDRARDVIDTVRRKGREASSVLIAALCEVDRYLSRQLKFS